MFIDRIPLECQRRAKGRNETYRLLTYLPPLRTAPEAAFTTYKHPTPNGVKHPGILSMDRRDRSVETFYHLLGDTKRFVTDLIFDSSGGWRSACKGGNGL